MTRLSRHRFRSNEVRLGLSVIAYNLGIFWQRIASESRSRRFRRWYSRRMQATGLSEVSHAGHAGPSAIVWALGRIGNAH
jgi:hypothetical protein